MRPSAPSDSASAPVAFFDSGLGGLTVIEAFLRLCPSESTLFVADQAHVPYGGRSLGQIEALAEGLTEHAFASGAKAVVMACNVSSATYAEEARERYGAHRVFGVVEPGARAAAELSRSGRIGLLATEGTVSSGAYERALARVSGGSLVSVACPRFVPLVEQGATRGIEAKEAASEALGPLLEADVDTVILGCTHYPYLLPALRRVAPSLRFVDPAVATATELDGVLREGKLPASFEGPCQHLWATTGALQPFVERTRALMGARGATFAELRWPLAPLLTPAARAV